MQIDVANILCQKVDNFTPFIQNGKGILFSKFQEDVSKFASYASKKEDKEVILFIPDDMYLFYVCFMGCLHAGKGVILPSFLTNTNLDNLKDISTLLFTTQNLSHPDMKILNPEQIQSDERMVLSPIENGYISFFTSGSTGTPKQIKKHLSTLTKSVQNHIIQHTHVIEQNPVIVATVLPYHIYGMLWRFLLALSTGLTQELETVFSAEEIQQKQSLYSKIALITTPTFMNEIAAYKDQYTFKDNCVGIYSSGSLLSETTSKSMFEIFGTSPFEIFGSTETGGVAWRQQINGPAWRTFKDVKIEILPDSTLSVDSDFCYQRPVQMQDSITLQEDGSFLLNGRLDRLVKIAENRIFLPEMEQKMSVLPYIKQAYVIPLEAKKGTFLGMLISLNETGKKMLCEVGKKELVQQIKIYLSDWYEKTALPKKFRFVNEIPTNQQGKILKNQVKALFETKITEPVMTNIKTTANKIAMDLFFLKDAPYFEGHFPKYPILPGVIQTHFVFEFLKIYFKKTPQKYTISKLKFSSLILPNINVHFEMEKLNENEYTFIYQNAEKLYSSGKITIEDENV